MGLKVCARSSDYFDLNEEKEDAFTRKGNRGGKGEHKDVTTLHYERYFIKSFLKLVWKVGIGIDGINDA